MQIVPVLIYNVAKAVEHELKAILGLNYVRRNFLIPRKVKGT
jgi:hypothetical protein